MIIAIDLDDTLHNTKYKLPGYRMGQPTKGAVMSVSRLKQQGHHIVIFTARPVQTPAVLQAVANWLDYFHIPYDEITNIKEERFDLMIDNRGVHFEDWTKTMFFLDTMTDQKLNNYVYEGDVDRDAPQMYN